MSLIQHATPAHLLLQQLLQDVHITPLHPPPRSHRSPGLSQMVLQAGHYDPEAIRSCAEKVAIHWQQLMLKMEDRLKLVNASVAFYKTSEQVHVDFPFFSFKVGA